MTTLVGEARLALAATWKDAWARWHYRRMLHHEARIEDNVAWARARSAERAEEP